VRSPRAHRPHPAPLRAPARPSAPRPTGFSYRHARTCLQPIAPCALVPIDSQPCAPVSQVTLVHGSQRVRRPLRTRWARDILTLAGTLVLANPPGT